MALLPGAAPTVLKDFFVPASHKACFPWESQALWLYTQMVFWRQTEHSPEHLEAARRTYRPDFYRAALAGIDPDIPRADLKPERFFDGREFDPEHLTNWLQRPNS
jgi:NitT/TauT family transport system ATP-binding protein